MRPTGIFRLLFIGAIVSPLEGLRGPLLLVDLTIILQAIKLYQLGKLKYSFILLLVFRFKISDTIK